MNKTVIAPNETPSRFIVGDPAEEALSSSALEPIPFCPEAGEAWPLTTTTAAAAMIRIPCKARGVDDTHTPQSGYFEIPADCVHGKTLVCSHRLCRGSGRVFRYCKVCNLVVAKRNFTKRHAHDTHDNNQTIRRTRIPLVRADSLNSKTKKRKVSVDAEGDSFVSIVMDAMGTEGSTSESDTSTDRTSVVPSTVYAIGDPDSVFMMVSRAEANLLDLVRRRASNVDRLIQDLLLSTEILSSTRIMEEDIITDDESEREPTSRMPSLERFDVFTESFENLMMK
ncbi:hypothetical protein MHU86_4000 [Fragilaria crotonensis]|nr:hypothetical protein MHU86_4000 [Fragilaria crotonensis]